MTAIVVQMILLRESNDTPKGAKIHLKGQITLLVVVSFDPFKGVVLDIDLKVSYDSF